MQPKLPSIVSGLAIDQADRTSHDAASVDGHKHSRPASGISSEGQHDAERRHGHAEGGHERLLDHHASDTARALAQAADLCKALESDGKRFDDPTDADPAGGADIAKKLAEKLRVTLAALHRDECNEGE